MSICFSRFQVIVELFDTVPVHCKFTIPLFRYWKKNF